MADMAMKEEDKGRKEVTKGGKGRKKE